jgi:hypothetical protein
MNQLKEIFELQEKLNDLIFLNQNIKDNDGNILKMNTIKDCKDLGPNGELNKWLVNFLKAMKDETNRELSDELLWKWWSADKLDLQNIKVELIDILHFWASMCLCLDMNVFEVFDIYFQKMKVNMKRQKEKYSKENKNEHDNRGIKTEF